MSRTRIQRIGWVVLLAGVGSFAISFVASLPSLDDSYRWHFNGAAGVLVDTMSALVDGGSYGLTDPWERLGYLGFRLAICGAAIVFLGNFATSISKSLVRWVSHGE